MSAAIQSVRITSQQLVLLENAEGGELRVAGAWLKAARTLEGQGLGHVADVPADGSFFTINEAGRDQLRIRA